MNIQSCRNTVDAVPLYLPQGLYLKPIAKIHMSVQLPNLKSGKSVSNWEVMEKMRFMIEPEKFTVLKVINSSMELLRFEGEIEDRGKLESVLSRLDGRQLKLTNISDNLRIRAAEAKDEFPSRHSWDSFFRDAKNMNESKPGERPDTIHITNLPIKWFVHKSHANEDNLRPSERIFCKVFERFGQIRNVDIPICDPYRHLMKAHMSGMQTFNFDQEMYFEGYVQFEEYMGFVRAMDALRGKKLLLKEDNESFAINIKVNFDTNKHLSDACIRRRKIVRDRFIARDKEKEERARKELEEQEKKKEMERQLVLEAEKTKEEERRQREEKRKMKQLQLLKQKETEEITQKIALEEKKLMITQRKLESIRLLEELFNRIKIHRKDITPIHTESSSKKDKKKFKLEQEEKMLRDTIVSKYRLTHEKQLQQQKEKIKKMEGTNILKSVLKQTEETTATTSSRHSTSMTSLSSEASDGGSRKMKKMKKKKKKSKKKKNRSDSDSDDEGSDLKKIDQEHVLDPNSVPPSWFGYGPPNGVFPFPGQFFQPPMMGRGGFFNRPFNPMGMPRGMNRGNFQGRRGFNPHWRGGRRGRGGYDAQRNNYYNSVDDEYTRYFKKISGTVTRSYSRSYSRSRSRSRSRTRRSYSRSRSRSRRHSRSRSRRSRSRSRRSRSRSRRSRSRSRRSRSSSDRSRSRNRSRSRKRSKSRSKSHGANSRSRSRNSRQPSRAKSNSRNRQIEQNNHIEKTPLDFIPHQIMGNKDIQRNVMETLSERLDENTEKSSERIDKNGSKRSRNSRSPSYKSIDSSKFISPSRLRNKRSRSWSLPRSANKGRSWSKSPVRF